jgi:hypothetical protein
LPAESDRSESHDGGRVVVKGGSDQDWTPEEINELVRDVLDKLGVKLDLGGHKIEVSVDGRDGARQRGDD